MKTNDKFFLCENGKIYGCRPDFCSVCKHCTDIFWDYFNGPYMFTCECGMEYEPGCKYYEDDGEDHTKETIISEQQKRIQAYEDAKKIVDNMTKEQKEEFQEKLWESVCKSIYDRSINIPFSLKRTDPLTSLKNKGGQNK